MFVRSYVIPAIALAGFAFAIYTVRTENKPIVPAQPVAQPASSDFTAFIAGAGIIEASTRNIEVGTPIAGVATQVHVKVGDRVPAGTPLFTIDDRAVRAELAVRQAALDAARQELAKLEALPRPEEIPPQEALVSEAQAQVEDARSRYEFMAGIEDKRAVSQDELTQRRWAVDAARARLVRARTDLDLLKAGAWKPDLEIARALVASRQAEVQAVKTDLERLTVTAPVDCQILQVNIRVGEFAQAGPLATPLMLIGNTDVLHVRIDIDENDAWRFRPGAEAKVHLRGNADLSTPVRFVRVEPYVVPKRSLTGDSTERVDTRVLQVIYAFDSSDLSAYVGQQVDAFIKAAPRGSSTPSPAPGVS